MVDDDEIVKQFGWGEADAGMRKSGSIWTKIQRTSFSRVLRVPSRRRLDLLQRLANPIEHFVG
jgi:hypothetical protein